MGDNEIDSEMKEFMVDFADQHLTPYLDFVEEKLQGKTIVAATIIMNLVHQLREEYNQELALNLLESTQMWMLEWTARQPHLFPELYAEGTTPEQAQSVFN
jgi:hypothetical protein